MYETNKKKQLKKKNITESRGVAPVQDLCE